MAIIRPIESLKEFDNSSYVNMELRDEGLLFIFKDDALDFFKKVGRVPV
jgi:hypothetical protein